MTKEIEEWFAQPNNLNLDLIDIAQTQDILLIKWFIDRLENKDKFSSILIETILNNPNILEEFTTNLAMSYANEKNIEKKNNIYLLYKSLFIKVSQHQNAKELWISENKIIWEKDFLKLWTNLIRLEKLKAQMDEIDWENEQILWWSLWELENNVLEKQLRETPEDTSDNYPWKRKKWEKIDI